VERNPRWAHAALLTVLLVAIAGRALATSAPDRLERFRELASSRLGLAQVLESDGAAETYREIYSLLDDEIVESLGSGSVFASLGFLQDRLDAFADAWGGASFRLTRLDRAVVGAFSLSDRPTGNSIRVYGRAHDEAALLATLAREGKPTVFALNGPPGGAVFFAAWEGAPSGRGTRALRVDLVRQHGDDVRVAWSTANVFPDGVQARAWSIKGTDVRIRYEVRYPGWTPGCDGQTEQEDLYRVTPSTLAVARAARQEFNAWHRDLHLSVARLFSALAARDETALAAVVPDKDLRARLPSLVPEPACDAHESGRDAVSVAAATEDQQPWSLTFRRAGARWRLTAAAPVRP
jgi:hypothetical protein